MDTALIYINRELNGAFWKNISISVQMADCILNQYRVLGYKSDNKGNDGLFVLTKMTGKA